MKKLGGGCERTKPGRFPILGLLVLILLPISGNGAEVGSRQRTILPIDVPPGAPGLAPSNVAQYASSGYGAWSWGPGTNEGRRFLSPAEVADATPAARLLSFFSMSDIHVTDKESPAQVPYVGWSAAFLEGGPGGLNQSAYSPVMLDTTHHVDAAVQTINALHRQVPFDFGIVLGDFCNSAQFNELRWFIDVMDGKEIVPSSGAHRGADAIDYQKPYRAAGLDRSIPWYAAIGNHDQFWMGIGYPTPKVKQAMVGGSILDISPHGPLAPGGSEGSGMYVGTVDGATPFGDVVQWGPTNRFEAPPEVAADPNRHILTEEIPSPVNFIREFFDTATSPPGHGFSSNAAGSTAACYSFLPQADLPLKVIVLDDTCKSNKMNQSPTFYGGGWIDAPRLAWLTRELQAGQDADQLMILATHIPIHPQDGLFDPGRNNPPQFHPDAGNQTETNVIALLHGYPNLLLVMAGHRHVNVVTPFPSPDPAHPEYGFWEVETASLRDFPRQFRTWEILRNRDHTLSIATTGVDPVAEPDSPAGKSIGYGVGAARLYGIAALRNAGSQTFNVELVKTLTPAMQAKIAELGEPLAPPSADAAPETDEAVRLPDPSPSPH